MVNIYFIQPLEIRLIHAKLKQSGLRIAKDKLADILDLTVSINIVLVVIMNINDFCSSVCDLHRAKEHCQT